MENFCNFASNLAGFATIANAFPSTIIVKPYLIALAAYSRMTENLELSITLDSPPSLLNGVHLNGHHNDAHLSNDTDIDNLAAFAQTYIAEVLKDYETCAISREISLIGRRDVLTGKGKFGIFGDGKEVPQVAMARTFQQGDWRSGYYRDQTLMFALGVSTPEEFMAQLYTDVNNDPFSGGRQMNAHFATPNNDPQTGEWLDQLSQYNMASDTSATAGQMARAVGLGLASKKYREIADLDPTKKFSRRGNEVCFCTIGDASTSEGPFWEAVNAAAVLRIPLAIFIWDDGYGISVPTEYQTAKGSISDALRGFEMTDASGGVSIYTAKAWDYPTLCEIFENGINKVRKTHIPAIFHIQEVTQPQGHSTSGSHERYKSKERLQWEHDFDCNAVMRKWILDSNFAIEDDLRIIEAKAKKVAREAKNNAWKKFITPMLATQTELGTMVSDLAQQHADKALIINPLLEKIQTLREPSISDMMPIARKIGFLLRGGKSAALERLNHWLSAQKAQAKENYSTFLYSESSKAAVNIPVVEAIYSDNSPTKNGYEIINACFDKAFEKYPNLFAFGEDVGHIGDVNQGFMNLQNKYGIERIFDVGIREWTIMGQAIGMSMRGLRPIAEIQYLDYVYYGIAPLTDDLACMRYRTDGIQQAPAIIRTRGHRLEGIWHSGSPMAVLTHALRGMYLCVPRNFVQAAGMYNTLLKSDDPAIVVESLNGYRLKEVLPDNIGEFTVPLGVPEVLTEGSDVTIVTYGSCVRIAQEAVEFVQKEYGIEAELIDIQTLLPFDLEHVVVESLKKTNRVIFFDEDMPGGATAYMLQEVLEKQGGYAYLDAQPRTLTAKEHRPPYGSDGDYFSKPNVEDVIELILEVVNE